ncbi:MAG: ATP-binding protein [Silvanigrellales bacterium]|nr:ATP-binding protein [Silvanigrellales bacterium]
MSNLLQSNGYFQRSLAPSLLSAAQHYPAIVAVGARQVGKTTLLREIFPHHTYVSLDLPSLAEQAESSPSLFLSRHPSPVLIDEVQYAPSLFRSLKAAIDEKRHEAGAFILTGSQKFTLMKGVSDSLAGRCALFSLEGLSCAELTDHSGLENFSSLPVSRGGFPELWRLPEMERDLFLRSYVSTYLERDVRQILNVVHLRDFERFLRACAIRSGQLLNKSDLARDVGISPITVNEWLSILEASNQLFLLEPWFANASKRMIKAPKLYLADSGLLCFLIGANDANWREHPLSGAIWETFVFGEIRKALAAHKTAAKLFFYRDAQGREVDFLLESTLGPVLVEAKARENLTAADGKSFHPVSAVVGATALHAGRDIRRLVCGLAPHASLLDEKTWSIPGSQMANWVRENL